MECKLTRTYKIVLSKGDIIRLLKAENPENLVIQAMPASGADVTLTAAAGCVVATFIKEG
jgi:hypothetical protein